MKFLSIKTRPLLPPKDDVFRLLDESLPKLKEGDVVFITSKILSIHQGRCIRIQEVASGKQKLKLIKSEADKLLMSKWGRDHKIVLTIKDYTLIPSAGIDESNANGYFILWPKNVNKLVKEIWQYLKKKHKVKKLAVITTDSHTTPLRMGVGGISVGFFGLEPVRDMRGSKDIFGRKLLYTQVNIVDNISAMAVLLMGEGSEQTPLMILRGAKFIKFTTKNTYRKLVIEPKQDLYYPLLKLFKKK